jgi:hypothetical protein
MLRADEMLKGRQYRHDKLRQRPAGKTGLNAKGALFLGQHVLNGTLRRLRQFLARVRVLVTERCGDTDLPSVSFSQHRTPVFL